MTRSEQEQPSYSQINSATDPKILFFHLYHRLSRITDGVSRFSHLEAAGIIRLFLLDEQPLMQIVNRSARVKVLFVIARGLFYQFSDKLSTFGTPKAVGSLVMDLGQADAFSLDQFLAEPFLRRDAELFSVRELILHAANKIGGVHYDTRLEKKFADLHQLEPNSEVAIRICILQIGKLVLEALKPLVDYVNPLGTYDGFLGHYSMGDSDAIFHGEQFLECRSMANAKVSNGLSWVGRIRIGNQIREKSVLYQLRSLADGCVFSIEMQKLCLVISINSLTTQSELLVKSRPIHSIGLYETWFTLGINTSIAADSRLIRCRFGPYFGDEANGGGEAPLNAVEEMVIGADINGQNGGAFSLKELLILAEPSEELFSKAFEYVELKHS